MANDIAKRSGRVELENGKYINWGDYLLEGNNFFNEQQVTLKQAQITYNSDIPLSERRDVLTEDGNATVTKQGPEYRLRATSTTDDKAIIRSAQRGSYQSGSVFEPGMGFRTDGVPTGTAYYQCGYYDGNDGMLFRYDSEGYKFVVINSGNETEIPQSDWNIDTLDGSDDSDNPSGVSLDTERGVVFQTPFIYYGYGPIIFQIKVTDRFGVERIKTCHSFNNDNQPTVDEPNLPLWQEVFSGDGGQQLDLYVGGRQMSVWGTTDTVQRTTFARRTVTGVGTTNWVPMISVREKTGFEQVPIRLGGATILCSNDIEWEIHRGATLNGTDFTYLGNMTDAEIATEWDVSAGTTYTPGESIYGDIAAGGVRSAANPLALPSRPIYEGDTYTLAVRALSSTSSVTATFRIVEDW